MHRNSNIGQARKPLRFFYTRAVFCVCVAILRTMKTLRTLMPCTQKTQSALSAHWASCVFLYAHVRYAYAGVMLTSLAFLVMPLYVSAQSQADTIGSEKPSDSLFLKAGRPIQFRVNKAIVSRKDVSWLKDTLKPTIMNPGELKKVKIRTASSPEGPLRFNTKLTKWRYDAVKSYLNEIGITDDKMEFELIAEDYRMLVELMRENHDKQYSYVNSLVKHYGDDVVGLKRILMKVYGGKLWRRLIWQYFPPLRAVRLLIVKDEPRPEPAKPVVKDTIVEKKPEYLPFPPVAEEWVDKISTIYHREKWSVKTNLLLYGVYLSQYGWAPVPNVAVEYYPMQGHYTFGASFDCPWWQGNTKNHKYFQIRNYQLEGRYYFKPSLADMDYNGKKAYQGWYLQAYAHAFLYGIGFAEKKGWQGEGAGAGIGFGFVKQLGRHSRWSIELGAQFGGFLTKYDPYQYGCPVENTTDGLYYYKWTGSADMFKKRQYQTVYFGPTRLGVTLTYNLLYRKRGANGKPMTGWSLKKTTLKSKEQIVEKVKKVTEHP